MKSRNRTANDCYELCQLPMASLKELPRAAAATGLTFATKSSSWTIWGHPRWGVPGPLDMEVYMLLLELTSEQQLAKTVSFTAGELLRRLGWGTGSGRYERLRLSLCRWQDTTYVQSGLIKFSGKVDISEDRFKVLQQVQTTQYARAPWSCTWSDAVHWLIGNTFHRVNVDTDLYLRLDRPIAQAAYRYLCARCWHRNGYPTGHREPLLDWARCRLGIGERYPSKVKQNVLPALDELITAGFLSRYELHEDSICFFFATAPTPIIQPSPPALLPAAVATKKPARLPTVAEVQRKKEEEWQRFKEDRGNLPPVLNRLQGDDPECR